MTIPLHMLKYCPKREHFQLDGMIARTQLAVLDHNYSCNQNQARSKSGELRYRYPYSKVSQNWSAKPIMEKKDIKYLHDMLEYVDIIASQNVSLALTPDVPMNIAPKPMPSVLAEVGL